MEYENPYLPVAWKFTRYATVISIVALMVLSVFLLSLRHELGAIEKFIGPSMWGWLTISLSFFSVMCWFTAIRFQKYANILSTIRQWEMETSYMSTTNEMRHHPLYKEIVSMGRIAIPILLQALNKKGQGSFAFLPLEEITGESPVLPEHRGGGSIADIENDWLAWGRKNGYIT